MPLEFFLNFGWNTERWTAENLGDFAKLWAAREFGCSSGTGILPVRTKDNETHRQDACAAADEIADILAKYSKYNGRRKPELLAPDTYSLVNYQEAETVVQDFKTIARRAEEIYTKLPADRRDAFYELVLFPRPARS